MGDMADWINEQGELSDILDPCESCEYRDDCEDEEQCGREMIDEDDSIP